MSMSLNLSCLHKECFQNSKEEQGNFGLVLRNLEVRCRHNCSGGSNAFVAITLGLPTARPACLCLCRCPCPSDRLCLCGCPCHLWESIEHPAASLPVSAERLEGRPLGFGSVPLDLLMQLRLFCNLPLLLPPDQGCIVRLDQLQNAGPFPAHCLVCQFEGSDTLYCNIRRVI